MYCCANIYAYKYQYQTFMSILECSNDWGGRGYDDSVPGDGTKTTPSGDKTT